MFGVAPVVTDHSNCNLCSSNFLPLWWCPLCNGLAGGTYHPLSLLTKSSIISLQSLVFSNLLGFFSFLAFFPCLKHSFFCTIIFFHNCTAYHYCDSSLQKWYLIPDFTSRHENWFLGVGKLFSWCPKRLIGGVGFQFLFSRLLLLFWKKSHASNSPDSAVWYHY